MNTPNEDTSKDKEFADQIIQRLNWLISSSSQTKEDISNLIEQRIIVSKETEEHSTLQVVDNKLGLLGLLNGLVGTIQDGNKKNWGYISAEYEEGKLLRFSNTKQNV